MIKNQNQNQVLEVHFQKDGKWNQNDMRRSIQLSSSLISLKAFLKPNLKKVLIFLAIYIIVPWPFTLCGQIEFIVEVQEETIHCGVHFYPFMIPLSFIIALSITIMKGMYYMGTNMLHVLLSHMMILIPAYLLSCTITWFAWKDKQSLRNVNARTPI